MSMSVFEKKEKLRKEITEILGMNHVMIVKFEIINSRVEIVGICNDANDREYCDKEIKSLMTNNEFKHFNIYLAFLNATILEYYYL